MLATLAFIDTIDAVTGGVGQWVGHALLYGTLLSMATWLVLKLLGRRVRPGIHAGLWLVVLLKFLVPVGPGWSYSLASATGKLHAVWPQGAEQALPTPPAATPPKAVFATDLVDESAPLALSVAPIRSPWRMGSLLVAAYLAAVVVVAAARLASYRRFAAACKTLPEADGSTRLLVQDVCNRLGLRRVPDVRINDAAPAPYVLGLWRPMLILSRRQLVRSGTPAGVPDRPDELEAVVLHEVAHLRRGDLFVRYLQWCAGTLLFFWPVVAWVNRRIDLAREYACDEWALRHGRLSAGDYARCLLSALQPVRPGWSAYCPAAMAANLQTVERRIEMIMENPARSRRAAQFGIPALVLTLAWGAFALTGAASADDPAPSDTETVVETTTDEVDGETHTMIFVQHVETDGIAEEEFDIQVEPLDLLGVGELHFQLDLEAGAQPTVIPIQGGGPGVAKQVVVKARLGGGKEWAGKAGHWSILSDDDLATFFAAHPTADANSDGTLSKSEHDAFLVARAMSHPAAVLTQFPSADANADQRLDAAEAARLVSGGVFMRKHVSAPEVTTTEATSGGDGKVVRTRVAKVIRAEASCDLLANASLHSGPHAGTWVADNIAGEPSKAVVASYVQTVEDAPFAELLTKHPEADTNNDGKLSADERDAFFAKQDATMRAKLLTKFPEADANADGELTMEELAEYHKNRAMKDLDSGEAKSGVRKMVFISSSGDDAVTTEDVIIKTPE